MTKKYILAFVLLCCLYHRIGASEELNEKSDVVFFYLVTDRVLI